MLSSRLPLTALLLTMLFCPAIASAQTAPAMAVRRARALYYTPVDRGLESLRCDVGFDWKQFMEKAANQAVPADDARLRYLESIQLSVEDNLHGTGELHWTAPGPPPDASEESVTRIRDGVQQLWSGFFESWNNFVTGDLVTLDANAMVEATPSGYHVGVRTGSSLAEEQYDPALLLKSVHVTTPTLDSTMLPSFTSSAQGLLITTMRSSVRQPPTAEPTNVVMQVQYQPVQTFQVPSQLDVSVGPAAFRFQLSHCTVQTLIAAH
jgi:hypothetical protein